VGLPSPPRVPPKGPEEAPSAPRLRGFFFALCCRQRELKMPQLRVNTRHRLPAIQADQWPDVIRAAARWGLETALAASWSSSSPTTNQKSTTDPRLS
jgi:hypothetical protein